MSVKKRVKILQKMLNLYDNYKGSPELLPSTNKHDPVEFVKKNICDKNLFLPENDETITTFYDYCAMQPLLKKICDEKVWPKVGDAMLYLYITLFLSDQKNQFEIFTMLTRRFNAKARKKVFSFLVRPDFTSYITKKLDEVNINYYKNHKNISNIYELDKLKNELIQDISTKIVVYKRFISPATSSTCEPEFDDNDDSIYNQPPEGMESGIVSNDELKDCQSVDVLIKSKNIINLESSPGNIKNKITSGSQLSSKYKIDESISEISCSTSKTSHSTKIPISTRSSQMNSVTTTTPYVVRTTITQILRESADITKKTKNDEKRLQNLCKGSFDPNNINNLLTQIKESEEEAELFEIERKHLLGKISLEDAKIARLNVKHKNKQKALELKAHQKLLDTKLAKFKVIEEEKIRNAIHKSHSIVTAMRTSQLKVLEAKKQNAKNIHENSKALEELKIQQEQEELNRKIQLIRQIKELEHASGDHFQTMFGKRYELNLRTSCNMSIEQLKKALTKMKDDITKEITERREKILQIKSKQEEMLRNTKEKIAKYRKSKEESVKEDIPKVKKITEFKQNPELLQLKNKLELRRLQLAKIQRNTNAVLV